MNEDEFWRCTPRQFDARMKAHESGDRMDDARFGILAALIANSVPNKKRKKAAKPADFFPSLR